MRSTFSWKLIVARGRFRFSVQNGPSFDVVLRGRGSLDESRLPAPDAPLRLQTFPRRLPNF